MTPAIRNFLGFFILATIIAGCSSVKVRDGMLDTHVFQIGENLMKNEEYREAIEVYREFINRYPSSPLLENAYFEIGRAYYLDEQNIEAEVALDDFIRLYPGSELLPEALFLKGETIERDVEKPGRDQSYTHNAIEVYKQIVERYPESDYGEEAKIKIQSLRENLAKNEFLIARFYYRTKTYPSAEKRLKSAFQKYSDTETAPDIIHLLARTYLKEGNVEEARKLAEIMNKYYPEREETSNLKEEIEGAVK